MAFDLGAFIKRGFLDAVEKNRNGQGKYEDYQIILNAAGWRDKGVLTDADLVEIQAAIEKRDSARRTIKLNGGSSK